MYDSRRKPTLFRFIDESFWQLRMMCSTKFLPKMAQFFEDVSYLTIQCNSSTIVVPSPLYLGSIITSVAKGPKNLDATFAYNPEIKQRPIPTSGSTVPTCITPHPTSCTDLQRAREGGQAGPSRETQTRSTEHQQARISGGEHQQSNESRSRTSISIDLELKRPCHD